MVATDFAVACAVADTLKERLAAQEVRLVRSDQAPPAMTDPLEDEIRQGPAPVEEWAAVPARLFQSSDADAPARPSLPSLRHVECRSCGY
jgi:hypothetical protein